MGRWQITVYPKMGNGTPYDTTIEADSYITAQKIAKEQFAGSRVAIWREDRPKNEAISGRYGKAHQGAESAGALLAIPIALGGAALYWLAYRFPAVRALIFVFAVSASYHAILALDNRTIAIVAAVAVTAAWYALIAFVFRNKNRDLL